MEGNSKGWFPNGQQQFDYNFENNQEHGICTEWDSAGKKISELRFLNGAPVQNLLTGQRIQEEEDTGERNEVINLVNESPVIPVNQEPTPKAGNTQRDKPVIEITNTPQTAKPQKSVSKQPPETKAMPSVQISPPLDQLPPPPPPVPPVPTPAPPVKPVESPKIQSPGSSNQEEGLNPFSDKATAPTPPAKKTSKAKPASKPPAPKAKPNPFENSPPPPIPPEAPKPVQAAPPLPPLNGLNPFDSPTDPGSKPANPQALGAPPNPPTAPPPPLPNGLSPFDTIPPPPQPKPNPFEKVNSTSNQNRDPFDFAPLPPPTIPENGADENASPIPLGNVFNTPPTNSTESEIDPFELPPPSN